MSGEGYPSWPTTSTHDFFRQGGQAPVSGIYVPVPALNDPPLVIDAQLQRIAGLRIRITCELTTEQGDSTDSGEGVFYVFAKNATDSMAGLPGDFQFDMTRNVVDTIGVGFSVEEVVPLATPYLLLMSRTSLLGEVRIRLI